MNNNKRRPATSEHARHIVAVYQRLLPDLILLARSYRHPLEVAEEIVHDVMSQMLNVEHPAGVEDWDRYIVAAVRNRSIDEYRKHKCRLENETLLRDTAQLNDQPPSAESEYHDAQIKALAEAIEDMPAQWRRAIELLIQGADKWAVARATKLSFRTLNKEGLRRIAQLAKSLIHKRDEK
ncbi:RNA polymerase sigma factor [Steroidobacter flavus]|uniref:RNA polymerase sigma factor n=1 Tax=Steroidobacter flavus TaxID=1842136 RepID=A0ABV8SVA7_9GAMM